MRDVGDGDRDDMSARIALVRIGLGVDGVVVVLGVGRVDGDERQFAPVLAAGARRCGLGGLRLRDHGLRKSMRDFVRVDGDDADRALALERAELLLDARRCQAEAALPLQADRDQVAVLRVLGVARRDGEFLAELLLVDRHQPPATARQRTIDAEHALLGVVDHLDDPAAVADVLVVDLLDAKQRAVSDAGGFARLYTARQDADFRRGPERLVPFGRRCDQFAIGVARGDVREGNRGQGAGMMQLAVLTGDAPVAGQHRAAPA